MMLLNFLCLWVQQNQYCLFLWPFVLLMDTFKVENGIFIIVWWWKMILSLCTCVGLCYFANGKAISHFSKCTLQWNAFLFLVDLFIVLIVKLFCCPSAPHINRELTAAATLVSPDQVCATSSSRRRTFCEIGCAARRNVCVINVTFYWLLHPSVYTGCLRPGENRGGCGVRRGERRMLAFIYHDRACASTARHVSSLYLATLS